MCDLPLLVGLGLMWINKVPRWTNKHLRGVPAKHLQPVTHQIPPHRLLMLGSRAHRFGYRLPESQISQLSRKKKDLCAACLLTSLFRAEATGRVYAYTIGAAGQMGTGNQLASLNK